MNNTANCENCVHAVVTTGRTVIMKNGMTIIQQTTPGGKNITCKAGTRCTAHRSESGRATATARRTGAEAARERVCD